VSLRLHHCQRSRGAINWRPGYLLVFSLSFVVLYVATIPTLGFGKQVQAAFRMNVVQIDKEALAVDLCHAPIVTVNCEGTLRPRILWPPQKTQHSLASRIKGVRQSIPR